MIFIDRLLIGWFRFIHPMASIQRKIAQSSKAELSVLCRMRSNETSPIEPNRFLCQDSLDAF
ncbi:MAG TPA: hypothetical protein DEP78_04680, partial [Verrucomicrobiales bacterium]|nr:hypothetical protein [Verrucomicrobiales bacterium]